MDGRDIRAGCKAVLVLFFEAFKEIFLQTKHKMCKICRDEREWRKDEMKNTLSTVS